MFKPIRFLVTFVVVSLQPLFAAAVDVKNDSQTVAAISSGDQSMVAAAQALVERVLPGQGEKFICEIIPSDDGRDVFELDRRGDKIVLRGNNGVSIASALNWYLNYYCFCQVSSCGDQLALPQPLPAVKGTFRKISPHKYRYAFNYCTFGYGMAFWDWARWEREIDYMALHGINAPLAATGAEVVHRNVYRELGLSKKGINDFIAGPPFLPWFQMGNIDGWGGPNPDSWYERQEKLQKLIVEREQALGMKPVLPAFGGHVPATFKEKFPNAKVARLKSWSGFQGVYVLDPEDPLFRDLGARFIRETIKLYGTSHIYSTDTFNEVDPPSTDPAYLKGIAREVYQSMADADPEALWVMQGWLFVFSQKFWTQARVDALLSGVPDDKMLILDLFADGKPQWKKTNAFSGKPWLWCIINNWGGKQGMYGRLDKVGNEMPKLLRDPSAGKLSGIGTLNEGNDVNPIVFEQLYQMAWRDEPMNVAEWVRQYVRSRYGKENANAQKAWAILAKTLYACGDQRHGPQGNFLAMPPSLKSDGGGFVRGDIFYDTAQIREAFRLLLAAANELGELDTYRYDLTDLGRQVMSDFSQQNLHAELRAAYAAKDAKRFDKAADAFCQAILDTDKLLRAHQLFQLGNYLRYPKHAVSSAKENAVFEQNARRLITLWGGRNSTLFGYAQRQYGGMMADYNLNSWKLFLNAASVALHDGTPFDVSAADRAVRDYTEKWIRQTSDYPDKAEGNVIGAAQMIWENYGKTAAKPTVGDTIVGSWEYTVKGKKYVRVFDANGSLKLIINGAEHKGWRGYTWQSKDGEILCRKADGTVFGKHRLQDSQTLLFIGEPYGPAVRIVQHHE